MREQRFGGTDTFTLTLASHTIRLGGEIWRNEDTMDQLYARYGMYNYASFSAFALDFSADVKQLKDYTTFSQTLGTPATDLQSMLFNAFGQDTWKALPGLTITAGVRWEKPRLPQPSQPNPSNYLSEFIPSPNTDVSPTCSTSGPSSGSVAAAISNRFPARRFAICGPAAASSKAITS